MPLIYVLYVILLMLGNEWKTRYETQEEINVQLQRQILLLQQKIESTRHNLNRRMYFIH